MVSKDVHLCTENYFLNNANSIDSFSLDFFYLDWD